METEARISLPRLGRKTPKAGAIVDRLRERIVRDLAPAAQLSTFNEMARDFGVSRAVLRDAIEELKRDGFIYSVDRQGLYVADRPPHLSRFGLVFAGNPASPEWPRFYTAIQQEAVGLQQERGDISFKSYFDTVRGPGSESYDRLVDDVRSHRVAGLLLMPGAHPVGQSGPFAGCDVPMVYVCGDTAVGRTPSVATDDLQMCDRMADWLRQRGRKRVAVVALWGNSDEQRQYLLGQGVPARPHWVQTVGRDNLADVRRLMPLLMDYPQGERPDGLIVLDDNLTEHAVGGLLDCGLRVGHDLDVIAHCNWPWAVASPVPIGRVGFHAKHVVSTALAAIGQMRRGRTPASDMVRVPALFEAEIGQPWQAAGFETTEE